MPRVLAYTSPARGHLYPLTSILLELRSRGHDVVVRTLASEVGLMRGLGFDAEAIDPRVEAVELADWQVRGAPRQLAASVRAFTARAEFDAPDLEAAIRRESPDVVVVDINSWGALAAAERWGGPWSAFCPYPLALRSPDVPPFGPGFAPARGVLGRLRDRAVGPLVTRAVEKEMLGPMNVVRAGLGLECLASSDAIFRRPPLVLSLTAEPFEYPRSDWPDSVVQVGPCGWEPPAESPEWLGDLTAPLVLVTTSSEFQDDGRLVATALEALADDPVQVVATVPSGDPASFRLPPNARVERFVPHGPLLQLASCAVTHGGMGATQKALALGVPVCAVPFGRDQHEVARRVEVAGAGTRLPARRLTVPRLRTAVREATACAAGARRVADGFARAGGAAAAASAVEERLLAVRA
jgi:MGT family glycosyltransferase